MPRVLAICSCPRLGFMDFMGRSLVALVQNGCAYVNTFGVYWAQSLSNALLQAKEEYDYIITTDFDTIYTRDDVAALLSLMQNNEADAICTMQMGRFHGVLFSTESGEVTDEALQQDLIPIETGNFGLSIFKASVFNELKKPWFLSTPNEDGDWLKGKTDADIYFWRNFKVSGKQAYLAPRIVTGHLELVVTYPGRNLQPTCTLVQDYHKYGKPEEVWR